jgi:hypothetical protein
VTGVTARGEQRHEEGGKGSLSDWLGKFSPELGRLVGLFQSVIFRRQVRACVAQETDGRVGLFDQNVVAGERLHFGFGKAVLAQQSATQLDTRNPGVEVVGRECFRVQTDRITEHRLGTGVLFLGVIQAAQLGVGKRHQIMMLAINLPVDVSHAAEKLLRLVIMFGVQCHSTQFIER